MFCPKCGRVLTDWNGTLRCQAGDMPLSDELCGILTIRYSKDAPPQSEIPAINKQIHSGFKWFCPGCGRHLNHYLGCDECGKHLRDIVYILVELHPHR